MTGYLNIPGTKECQGIFFDYRWACLPLASRFYHPKKVFEEKEIRIGKKKLSFQTKLDLSLSVEQIVEYYGARWKIEAGFKELKRSSQFSVSVPKPSGGGQPHQLFHDGRSGHPDLCHAT
jgi:hypothetical protein